VGVEVEMCGGGDGGRVGGVRSYGVQIGAENVLLVYIFERKSGI
jgi:hypothetical protein